MGDRQRGAAAVEMAVLSIFLIVLVMGIIDLGRGIFSRISIEDAAQEAATFASYEDPLTVTQIQQRAVDAIDSPQIVLTDVTVNCYVKTGSSRDTRYVEVSVSFDQDLITPVVSAVAGPLTLNASAISERFITSFPTGTCPVSTLP